VSSEEIVPLRDLHPSELDEVLAEETEAWRNVLEWDHARHADRTRVLLDVGLLVGYALRCGERVAGYCSISALNGRGSITDLFVSRDYRQGDGMFRLLSAALNSFPPGTEYVDWYPMLPTEQLAKFPHADRMVHHTRDFMIADCAPLPERPLDGFTVERWNSKFVLEAAALVVKSYAGHEDATLSDHYASFEGASANIERITNSEDDGTFLPDASIVVLQRGSGAIAGFVLMRAVMPGVAHGALLCVAPAAKRTGVGYELVRRAIAGVAALGYRRVSLIVGSSNLQAIALYSKAGFGLRCLQHGFRWQLESTRTYDATASNLPVE
jgi:ribosomal protein S18 acetylase RimI-like enzyme